MQPFPHPNDATHKIWSRLATGFRDIQVQKCEIFVTQGQVTPKWVVWSSPNSNSTKLLCLSWVPATLMMIWPKMNELAWRQHFPIISLWKFFRRSRATNSVVIGLIWPKIELVRDFMHWLVTCKYKRIRWKTIKKRWRHRFPHYKSMGAFCCHGNQSFDPICPKTLCSLSPHPRNAAHKTWSRLVQWLQRYSSLKVWTTDRRTTDHWYTKSLPCEPLAQVS